MMRHLILLLFASIQAVAVAFAGQQPADSLATWAAAMPETIDGVKIYPPVEENGRVQVSDLVDLPSVDRTTALVNALVNIYDNLDPEIEEIENRDLDGCRILLRRSDPNDKTDATYNYSIALQMADDMMSFLIYDISVSFKEKGIIPRTMPIEKMRTAQNRRHKELVEGFARTSSAYVARIADAIKSRSAQKVAHWNEVKDGTVVKGMNPTEVKIIKGKPTSERASGKRIKWMYGNENVIVFTDGVVTTVI